MSVKPDKLYTLLIRHALLWSTAFLQSLSNVAAIDEAGRFPQQLRHSRKCKAHPRCLYLGYPND